MKKLIVNIIAVFVIVLGGMTLSTSTAMNYNALDKCGECATNDPKKCCTLNEDGSCYTHICIDVNKL